MSTKAEIIEYAKTIEVENIGFSDINFNKDFLDRLREKRLNGSLSGFEEEDENIRSNVKALLDNACTIISIALPYKTCETDKSKPYLSKSSLGIDYHNVLKDRLEKMADFLKNRYEAKCICFCDIGPLSDREIAKKCGIGFYGKNTSIINKKYGSFIFLGEIVTDLYIERDNEIENRCGSCELCIKSCPSKAIERPFYINSKKCISYLTQKKDDLSNEEMDLIGNRIYGCDTCQDVCPYNNMASLSNIKEFNPENWNIDIDVEKFLNMSNKDFNVSFKKTSSGWRGKKVLIRNLIIAMGNSGNKYYINILKKYINNEYLRSYILRSIKKLEK